MTPRTLTEADELLIVARYGAGLSTTQLAERFRVDEATVRRVLDSRGVARRPRQAKAAVTAAEVAERRAAGWTWAQVAEWAGCSVTTVRNRWKEVRTTSS